MRIIGAILSPLLACLASLATASALLAQNPQGVSPLPEVVVAQLSPPSYPPLARNAHISGDVEVTVLVRQDGTVESTNALGGNPMLRGAALESARLTRYECRRCTETATLFRILYKFSLGETWFCESVNDVPPTASSEVTQSPGTLTIATSVRPLATCDGVTVVEQEFWRVRSAKCLFLWKCGLRPASLPHYKQ